MSKRQWFEEDLDGMLTPMTADLAKGMAIGLGIVILAAIIWSIA